MIGEPVSGVLRCTKQYGVWRSAVSFVGVFCGSIAGYSEYVLVNVESDSGEGHLG